MILNIRQICRNYYILVIYLILTFIINRDMYETFKMKADLNEHLFF